MKVLDKEQSRRRFRELRALWCAWDPIGVMDDPDWPRDEYDAYVGGTLRQLEQGASVAQLAQYLDECVTGAMGLGEESLAFLQPQQFAEQVHRWYRRHWPGTTVPGS